MSNLFAVCAPGLEKFLTQELGQLGYRVKPTSSALENIRKKNKPDDVVGGVEFRGSLQDLYRTNLHLRTASRVLIRLGTFYADAFSDLLRRARRLPWQEYLFPGQPVAFRVTCHQSRLYHTEAVAESIARAIGDRLGMPPMVRKYNEDPSTNLPQLIVVRLVDNHCTISLDSSGSLLHRRGYRQATAKAPLRETLAAGMLLASGWDSISPLLDPFCGSGTIAIEAALLAQKIAPGRARHFAFLDWPNFNAVLWKAFLLESEEKILSSSPKIFASDRDAGAIQAARANAERAGVADCIEFSCRAVSAITPPPDPGWVITNPPYGVRVSAGKDLRNLFAQFGKILRAKCLNWKLAMLCDRLQFLKSTGLKFDKGIPLRNGGLRVRLMQSRVK
jgi:putative N6-adenine-specific DNA methylase